MTISFYINWGDYKVTLFIIAFIIIEWIIIVALLSIEWHKERVRCKQILIAIRVLMTNKKLKESRTSVEIQGDRRLLNKYYIAAEFIDTKPKLMWAFNPQDIIKIGRGRENEIQIQNLSVSRMHGQIFEDGNSIFIYNNGNRNVIKVKSSGIFKRDILYAGEYIQLTDKDILSFGDCRIKIHIVRGREIYRHR